MQQEMPACKWSLAQFGKDSSQGSRELPALIRYRDPPGGKVRDCAWEILIALAKLSCAKALYDVIPYNVDDHVRSFHMPWVLFLTSLGPKKGGPLVCRAQSGRYPADVGANKTDPGKGKTR
jgi:hypothetical protein